MLWSIGLMYLVASIAFLAWTYRQALRALLGGILRGAQDAVPFLRFNAVPATLATHTGAVIWLHGFEDCGKGVEWLRKELADGHAASAAAGMPHVKVILPDAPIRAVTCKNGQMQLAWFDKATPVLTMSEPDDMAGLESSIARVHTLIDAQMSEGIAPERIVLGGFGMGAALAAWAVRGCPLALGACAPPPSLIAALLVSPTAGRPLLAPPRRRRSLGGPRAEQHRAQRKLAQGRKRGHARAHRARRRGRVGAARVRRCASGGAGRGRRDAPLASGVRGPRARLQARAGGGAERARARRRAGEGRLCPAGDGQGQG